MKPLLRCFVLAAFAISSISAQTFSIKGKVIDDSNEVVAFANILLLNATDSTFVQGTSADEQGIFNLEDIAPSLYLLQASYVGRASKPLALDVKNDISLGALIIPAAAQTLDEVVVTAKRPTLERLSDRLVFNVENTVVSQGSSWDILRSTPGVIVNQEDLQIKGQSATVYLNDRKVQLSGQEVKDLLEGLSGTNIKSVEVVANPPARYDAEGGPILNIVTSKNIIPGYKGSVNGSFTQAIFPKYVIGTSHYFKTDKLSLFGNYSFNPKKESLQVDKGINFINDSNDVFSRWSTDDEQITDSQIHTATVIADYDIDGRNSLNLTSNLSFNPDQEWRRNLDAVILDGQNQLDSTFVTDNSGRRDRTNLAFDVNYMHKFKKEGAQLSLNAHYTDYGKASTQNILSDYFDATGGFSRSFGFRTDANQDIQILTGQADLYFPFGTTSLETGLKVSTIDSQNSILYSNFLGNSDVVDSSLSDDFEYNESIYAAYVSILKSWEKWSVKAGVRGEQTNAEGISRTLDVVNSQDFLSVFPSLNVLFTASESHSFSFDYDRGVARPRYNDLNPFRFFYNENDFEDGNPRLQPNFTNNFNLNYTLNNEFFFDLYYRDNGNYISDLVFQDNNLLVLRQLKQNVLESTSYGIDFTLSKSIANPWFLYAYTSIFHEDETFLAVESGDIPATNSIEGFYVYLANYLTLSEDGSFTGEVTFTHFSKYLFGSYVQSPTTNLTLGLRKSFWNNRAVISIAAEDLLGKANGTYTSQYLNQDNFYFSQPETQFVRFGFTYNFGNFRLEDNERTIEKKERERLENQ
ncbi:outer membrane beta-barrel family protein [Allomuricauda sp. d1]|uniref:outer membrane beta-barrel family protein n=1 Tax=Allomuricauda sp. d1 TaxID=3136725 RepID=UPI0031E3D6CA